jgi:hypothetical protein
MLLARLAAVGSFTSRLIARTGSAARSRGCRPGGRLLHGAFSTRLRRLLPSAFTSRLRRLLSCCRLSLRGTLVILSHAFPPRRICVTETAGACRCRLRCAWLLLCGCHRTSHARSRCVGNRSWTCSNRSPVGSTGAPDTRTIAACCSDGACALRKSSAGVITRAVIPAAIVVPPIIMMPIVPAVRIPGRIWIEHVRSPSHRPIPRIVEPRIVDARVASPVPGSIIVERGTEERTTILVVTVIIIVHDGAGGIGRI